MQVPVDDRFEIYEMAVQLATDLDHPLFDTLYHAVALSIADATLVTADARYARKAQRIGRLTLLEQ